MRVACISDIHGCPEQLVAVLDDIAANAVDQVVCLGDIADLGPYPHETLAKIRALNCPTVQGNHDPFLDDEPCTPVDLHLWSKAQLTPDDLSWLRSLPLTLKLDLGNGNTMLCVHGSPQSFNDQMLESTPTEQLDAWLADTTANVVVAGHTHVQFHRIHGKQQHVIGVGSVGIPFAEEYKGGNVPPKIMRHAEYAIVECHEDKISVDLRQVPYDFEAFAANVRCSAMKKPEEYLSSWTEQA